MAPAGRACFVPIVARGPVSVGAASRTWAGCRHVVRPALAVRSARARGAARCSLNDALVSGGVPPGAASGIEDLPLEAVPHVGPLPDAWARPGVYGVYDAQDVLQYVAAVRNVRDAIDVHREVIGNPTRVARVRMITVESENDAPLPTLAYNWVVAHTRDGPGAPPGNTDAAPEWRVEAEQRAKGTTVYFRSDAGPEHVDSEIRRILRNHKVVLFMKGTREQPRCGFSSTIVELLSARIGKEFECVDCLDEVRNKGLRDGIKKYSDWPTIPQLYINGDFVGGLDIVTELDQSGELAAEFEKAEIPVVG